MDGLSINAYTTGVDQPFIVLTKGSVSLLNKEELIVFNKIDLIENKQIEDKLDEFRKKIKKNFLLMSTLDKKTVSKIKSKLINYVP